jgi:hypothetical protein
MQMQNSKIHLFDDFVCFDMLDICSSKCYRIVGQLSRAEPEKDSADPRGISNKYMEATLSIESPISQELAPPSRCLPPPHPSDVSSIFMFVDSVRRDCTLVAGFDLH